jgi:hypothetical protein
MILIGLRNTAASGLVRSGQSLPGKQRNWNDSDPSFAKASHFLMHKKEIKYSEEIISWLLKATEVILKATKLSLNTGHPSYFQFA